MHIIYIYIYIYMRYMYIYVCVYLAARDSFKQVGILHQMFTKVCIALSRAFSLHHAFMALTRSPPRSSPSQHSFHPCGSSLPRFLPVPRTWPHATPSNHPRYPSHPKTSMGTQFALKLKPQNVTDNS